VQVAEDEVLNGLAEAERRQLKRLLGAVWLRTGTKSPAESAGGRNLDMIARNA